MLEYETRDYLVHNNIEQYLQDVITVCLDPINVISLDMVDYWFFDCIYQDQKLYLEQRYEITSTGDSVLDESLIEAIPDYYQNDSLYELIRSEA